MTINISLIVICFFKLIMFSSCSSISNLDANNMNSQIEYSISAKGNIINKIIYTTDNGYKIINRQHINNWSKKISVKKHKVIKLEIFGMYTNNSNSDIKLSIRKYTSSDSYTIRDKTYRKKKNKYFHYYLISET